MSSKIPTDMWFLLDSGVKNKMEDISSCGANNLLDVRSTIRKFWRNWEPESQTWEECFRKALSRGRYQQCSEGAYLPLQGWGWTNERSKRSPLGHSIISLGMWITIGLAPPRRCCCRGTLPACLSQHHLNCWWTTRGSRAMNPWSFI